MTPCVSCFGCGELQGYCVIKDSFQELRELWVAGEVIIYSVPAYHVGIPGPFGRYRHLFPAGVDGLPKQLKVVASFGQGLRKCSRQEYTIADLINRVLIMQAVPVVGHLRESYVGPAGLTANGVDRGALARQSEQGERGTSPCWSRLPGIWAGGAAAHKLQEDPAHVRFVERVGG